MPRGAPKGHEVYSEKGRPAVRIISGRSPRLPAALACAGLFSSKLQTAATTNDFVWSSRPRRVTACSLVNPGGWFRREVGIRARGAVLARLGPPAAHLRKADFGSALEAD